MRERRLCPQIDKCPLASSPTCLDPPLEYFDLRARRLAGECLFCHLLTAAELWEQAANRNLRPLLRLLSGYIPSRDLTSEGVRILVKATILLHDAGKLCEQYRQPPRWEFFRHEFLSAHMALKFATDPNSTLFSDGLVKLAPIIAGAVLIHHESRLIRMLQWTGDVELRWEHVESCMPSVMELKADYAASFAKLLRRAIGYGWKPEEAYAREEVIESVVTILGHLNYRPKLPPYFARALVGAITNIISVCDSISAQRTRSRTADGHALSKWERLLNEWGRGFV